MSNILNPNAEYLQNLADEYDVIKLKMENTLERKLDALFRRMGREVSVMYAITGVLISLDDYILDLHVILSKSYRDAGDFFSKHIERELEKIEKSEEEEDDFVAFLLFARALAAGSIIRNLRLFNSLELPKHTSQILNTTENIFKKNIDKAKLALAQESPTDKEIGILGAKNATDENMNRSKTIAQTEVGNAEANAGHQEADSMNDVLESGSDDLGQFDISDEDRFKKVIGNWLSLLDEKTREAHLRAHGQQQLPGSPFLVGGELLRYPRDTSLGATAGNTINCR